MQAAIVLVMWGLQCPNSPSALPCCLPFVTSIFVPFLSYTRGDYVVHGAGVTICMAVFYLHRGQERYPAIMRRHGFQRRVIQFRIPLGAPLLGLVGPKRAGSEYWCINRGPSKFRAGKPSADTVQRKS